MLELTINGELKSVSSSTLNDLLLELGLQNKKLAVELNKKIVPRDNYSNTCISSGDSLEIVHFIGGG